MGDCKTGVCGQSSNCRESVDCGEPGGGETGGIGETGDGREPDSKSTLKSKMSSSKARQPEEFQKSFRNVLEEIDYFHHLQRKFYSNERKHLLVDINFSK